MSVKVSEESIKALESQEQESTIMEHVRSLSSKKLPPITKKTHLIIEKGAQLNHKDTIPTTIKVRKNSKVIRKN